MTKMSSLHDATLFLAQQAAPGTPPSAVPQFIFLGLMLAAMYFLMIAPQRKKQKELEKMLAAITTGDDEEFTGKRGGTDSMFDFCFGQTFFANFKVLLKDGFVFGNSIFD